MITSEILYLSIEQAADRLGVSIDSVWGWVRTADFPCAVTLSGRTTRWRLADIEAWDASRQFCFAGHFLQQPEVVFAG